MNPPLLRVENLKKYFPVLGGVFKKTIGHVHAVDGVSFEVPSGETLGIVGESGCGKSTLGRTILKLHSITEGKVFFGNHDITSFSRKQMRPLRRDMQIIFQDPFFSLNPKHTVYQILLEPLQIHNIGSNSKERIDLVRSVLEKVGLRENILSRYPHEFSGGQRQRLGIARAIILKPKLIIADEPVSALDVSIQSQILNLLKKLQKEFNLTYLFIAHDLAVVEHISSHIAVMYLGEIVEMTETEELLKNPLHPYTQALISAIPVPDPDVKIERIILKGDVPSPINPPLGCRFHPRCPFAKAQCLIEKPPTRHVGKHLVACHLYEK